jgi:hypothetical protein
MVTADTRRRPPMRPSRILSVIALVAALPLAAACKPKLEVDPGHGTYTGGDTVTIHSDGLFPVAAGGVVVFFGKKKASAVVILSENDAQVQTPAGEADSTVDVEIDLPDGRRFSIPQAFKYVDTSVSGTGWADAGVGH